MKKITIILLALFFKAFAFSQESKIEFSNLNIKPNDLLDHKLIFVDENRSLLISKNKIVDISKDVRILDVDDEIFNKNLNSLELSSALDTLNLRYYNVVQLFNSICINSWDFKNSSLSKIFKTELKPTENRKFYLYVNSGNLNLFVKSNLKIEIFEVNLQSEMLKLIKSFEGEFTNTEIIQDETGKLYKIKTKIDDQINEISVDVFDESETEFKEKGVLKLKLNDQINNEQVKIASIRRIKINPINDNQIVIYYSQLADRVKSISTVPNRYQEHFIYECDIKTGDIIEKAVSDKIVYSTENKGLEIVFHNNNVIYLELVPVMVKDDKGFNNKCRLEYVFEENSFKKIKIYEYTEDIIPYVLGGIDEEELLEINKKPTYDLGFQPEFTDKSNLSIDANKLVSYRFMLRRDKTGYQGYYRVIITQI